MATSTLAKSPESDRDFDGQLIEGLTDLVPDPEKPELLQSEPDGFTIPDSIPTDEDRRARNAEMLNALWILGEQMAAQAFELPQPKPDPLTIALNGFPDVYTYYADAAGR